MEVAAQMWNIYEQRIAVFLQGNLKFDGLSDNKKKEIQVLDNKTLDLFEELYQNNTDVEIAQTLNTSLQKMIQWIQQNL
jgi:hypothetical protein